MTSFVAAKYFRCLLEGVAFVCISGAVETIFFDGYEKRTKLDDLYRSIKAVKFGDVEDILTDPKVIPRPLGVHELDMEEMLVGLLGEGQVADALERCRQQAEDEESTSDSAKARSRSMAKAKGEAERPPPDSPSTLEGVISAGARRPSLSPQQLSTGTREQLFLALRMAYVAEACREREPLPVLVDDALVNFDRERAGRALDAFAALGADTQVLYLTCHPHLAELARDVGGRVISLDGG